LKPKKILILLPDGVGLRNFAFTSFVEVGKQMGWEVVFWNLTPFNLTELGYKEIKLQGNPRTYTDLLKRAKISLELDYFNEKFDDKVYQTYKFPSSNKGLKSKIKNAVVTQLIKKYQGESGLYKLREKLKASERKSVFYRKCKTILKIEKPDFIFCTNQRPVNAISPLTAAQDLGIKTGTFIFSWDNLPKATMIVEPDFYFVWSEYMKKELIKYYPFIKLKNIFITGSPQFEPHFNKKLRKNRLNFYKENNLNYNKEYICYSGDDSTTCPDDPHYLHDLAVAIESLNQRENYNLGIIFRRCPVDLSDRYDKVLKQHKDTIVPVAPRWSKIGGTWNSVIPAKEDLPLQINTILHTKAVVNMASSMVFDFAIFNKPCIYLNYNVSQKKDENWTPQNVYNFVHFRSMPTGNEVIWLRSKNEIELKLKTIFEKSEKTVQEARNWFEKINLHPAEEASKNIWEGTNKIYSNEKSKIK
jgi:hypothetical protein